MTPSVTCLAAIMGWEGCSKWDGNLFRIYPDLNGFSTIGRGHKLTHQEIAVGAYSMGLNQSQCDALFEADCQPFTDQVNGLGLTLAQGQWDCLFSFTYNLGINNTKTMLAHGIAMVPQELGLWVHADGKIEPGLVKRRAVELSWWNSGSNLVAA